MIAYSVERIADRKELNLRGYEYVTSQLLNFINFDLLCEP